MKLQVRRVRLEVITVEGEFGCDFEFPVGLVVLRAENTSGKSTLIKSIIYGLGLERMFGPANHPPLPPAMMSLVYDGKKEVQVIESSVSLELGNDRGEIMTVRRYAAGTNVDWRLVNVWDGPALSSPAKHYSQKPYFVRDPGAASREDGFHCLLSHFVGWELPEVLKYDGAFVPLYIELLLPLFYAEQMHGWSALQATTPGFFQIRDASKRALEYILRLESFEVEEKRQQLAMEEKSLVDAWHLLISQCHALVEPLNWVIRGIPPEPTAKWPPDIAPFVEVWKGGNPRTLADVLAEEKETLSRLTGETIPSASQVIEKCREELSVLYGDLADRDALGRELVSRLEADNEQLAAIDRRMVQIDEDLRKYRDIEKLRKFGAIEGLHVVRKTCPTCD